MIRVCCLMIARMIDDGAIVKVVPPHTCSDDHYSPNDVPKEFQA